MVSLQANLAIAGISSGELDYNGFFSLTINAARSASNKPRSWFACAAAHLIKPSARINGRENR